MRALTTMRLIKSARTLGTAVALTLGLTAGWSAATAQEREPAQSQDLLEAIDGFVGRLDRTFDYPLMPDFRLRDLYGKSVSPDDLQGRIAIFSFVDQKNEDEARSWLSEQSIDYMGNPNIVFVNVLYPGRIPFVVSRGNAAESIRAEIDRFLDEEWKRYTDQERQLFSRTTIRWLVDWKRDLQRKFNVTRDRVNIVIVDGQGRIRDLVRKKTPETVAALKELVAALERELGATAEVSTASDQVGRR
ncbi:MAG: hypothetical protein HY814_12465 [Candidatus Riflebacteria bacterium]|nr:hypothetical protein [Candidatus Riflebacteria bacterium]